MTLTREKKNILILSLEPAPYKIDLFNEFAESDEWSPFVFFTTAKDWSDDGGHDFCELPEQKYETSQIEGKTFLGQIKGIVKYVKIAGKVRPSITIVSGYNGPIQIFAIMMNLVVSRPYAFWTDSFNTDRGRGFFGTLRSGFRSLLRFLIFKSATLILITGRATSREAIKLGCSSEKIVIFPYVVDKARLQKPLTDKHPVACRADIISQSIIITFSSRHIERKGLPTLLHALKNLKAGVTNWKLWIEGEGPKRREYEELSQNLGLSEFCRFLGFCQMSVHSWLLLNSDIVVVPSKQDPWGIVVDEAMQLGKTVVASTSTGSAKERIIHGVNGFLFEATHFQQLAGILGMLIRNPELLQKIGHQAQSTARQWNPRRNVASFTKCYKKQVTA